MISGKIARLSSLTSHQLEAEQVIPDFSAALKELVENSLDANPETISITFINYGLDAIIIEDDGDGITPENMIQIASSRYATSKIIEEADLETSLSYGFRGEALHSLVKLSRKVCLLSSSDTSGFGICKNFSHFGMSTDSSNKPRTRGTTVIVEGLFESISVRRQDWIKRRNAIFAQSIFLLQSFAILKANIKFSAYNVKENSPKNLIFHCVGKDYSSRYNECIRTEHKSIENYSENFIIHEETCSAEGVFIRHLKENNKNRFVVFINNKPFESPKWQRLFQQMLKKSFVSGAEFFMSIHLPYLWIDYNVTPDKRTIFILNESDILKKIIDFCENKLKKDTVIETRKSEIIVNGLNQDSYKDGEHKNESCCWDEALIYVGSAESVQLSKNDILNLVPIGQFNNGFIICSKISEGFTELFAVDQHAADERIRFEEISSNYSISCQKLVHPIEIKLSLEDEDFVTNNVANFRSSGFLVRETEGKFFLDALPNFHGSDSNIEDFNELLRYLKDSGILYKNLCPKFHRILASRACRSAVMIGSPLTSIQIQRILDKLSQTEYPWICAHGRPTIQFIRRMGQKL